MSLGNWDNDGEWVPLMYHRTNKNKICDSEEIRGYAVPCYTESGLYSVSVCGDRFLRDGFQVRWLQQTNFFTNNGTYGNVLRDIVTLDNVSVTVYANQTTTIILNEGFDEGPNISRYIRACILASIVKI